MRVIAFVGPSGTGKSYRSVTVSKQYGADAIIDDGLLISHGKVIAGTSAKRQPTKIASVKHALYMKEWQCAEAREAIKKHKIDCLMILGTSDGMVQKIAKNIGVPPIEKIIRIEDVATENEMEMAKRMRITEGKHVIPVPTFEIKKDFSGYFIHPLRRFQKNLDKEDKNAAADKSIVRPTFSYMGDYTISDDVVVSMAIHEAMKNKSVKKVHNINLRKTAHGIHIDMTIILEYGVNIYAECDKVQRTVKKNIEQYTSLNVRRVNVLVKGLNYNG